MNQNEVRKVLYKWHSGQRSAVYAAASSGWVLDADLLDWELDEAQQIAYVAGNSAEVAVLGRARAWLQRSYSGPYTLPEDGLVALRLPWCSTDEVTAG
jgi:hypothetical protein